MGAGPDRTTSVAKSVSLLVFLGSLSINKDTRTGASDERLHDLDLDPVELILEDACGGVVEREAADRDRRGGSGPVVGAPFFVQLTLAKW